jgi:type II secretory pathway pseudopilin PulG
MRTSRHGFTTIEAVMVLLIVAAVIGALTPSVVRQISHARVNRAASVVAADFYLCQSLAGRQHSPIVITVDSVAMTTTVTTALPAPATLFVRHFDVNSEFKLLKFSASTGSVQVLPNGMVNASVLVTVGDGTYSRQVRMTRAGQIRVL